MVGRCGVTVCRVATNPTGRVMCRKTGARSAQDRMVEIINFAGEMKKKDIPELDRHGRLRRSQFSPCHQLLVVYCHV